MYFTVFCHFDLGFFMKPFLSVQKTMYLRVAFCLMQDFFTEAICTERKLQEKREWFQCVMHDRKNAFAKSVPLGERHVRHKMRTEQGFVFLCRGDTYEVQINMLTNAVRRKYWMTSAFPEHTASSPVRPYPKKQAVLEVVCYPCHWRKRIYAQKRAPVSYPYIYPASHICLQKRLYQNIHGSQELKRLSLWVVVSAKVHAHSSDKVYFIFLWQKQLVMRLTHQKVQLLSWKYFFFPPIQCPDSVV